MAAEYEVNIKINSDKIVTDLNKVDTKIKNLGKSATSQEKSLEKIVDKRARLMNRINELESKGLNVAKLRKQMGKATTEQGRRDLGNAQKEFRVLERTIRLEQSKLKILRAQQQGFPASPIRGIRSMMGSPAQIAASGRQRVSPIGGRIDIAGSPAQMAAIRKMEMAEIRADKNVHFAELKLIQKRQKIELDNVDKLLQADIRALEKFDKRLEASDAARAKRLAGNRNQYTQPIGPAPAPVQGPRQMIASPVGGGVNIPGSPAFLARQRRNRTLEQVGLGAGFPLLFGGGAGSVLGGGLGGLTGSFGAQIALSAAGQQIDSFFNQVRQSADTVANALDGTSASLEALETVSISVDAATIEYVRSLEDSGQAVAAYMQVQEELTEILGDEGVNSLLALQDANKDLNTGLGELQAVLMTELAPAFIAITKLGSGAADVLAKAVPILNFLFNPFRGDPIKEAEAAAALRGQQKIDAGVRERSAQIAANNEIESINNATSAIERQTEALKLGSDLTDKKVVAAKRFNIIEQSSAEIAILNREITAATMEPLRQQQLQAKKRNLEAKQAFDLAQLDSNVQGAIQRSLESQNKQTATLANKEERQLEAAVKLETRFARQVKLLEAGSNFEKEKLRIEFELEDQLNSIAQLENQSLAVQSELNAKKAAQLKLTEAQRKEEQRIAELRVRNLQEQGVPFSMEFAGLFGAYQSGGMGNFDMSTGIADLVRTEAALQAVLDKYPQIEQASLAMAETVTFGFRDIVDGAKSAEQVFADFLRSIADILMRTAAQMIAQYIGIGIARQFAGLGTPYTPKFDGSSLFNQAPVPFLPMPGFPGLANGGTATAGRPYIVGERGPELFVPGQTGTVVPNHAMGGANVTVNVDASGTQAQGNQPNAKLLGQAIGAAVQAELIKQKRPGGLLAV